MTKHGLVLAILWLLAWGVPGCRMAGLNHEPQLSRLSTTSTISDPNDVPFDLAVCFAPDTPRNRRDQARRRMRQRGGRYHIATFEFDDGDRWSSTATSGSGLTQGEPTVITWSIVPDGTVIDGFVDEDSAPSDLIAFLDGIYPNSESVIEDKPWFTFFEQSFLRWEQISGNTYMYEPNDDGSSWRKLGSTAVIASGQIGVRGDVRIAGHAVDGNSGILAYNFFPNKADMVLDTGDSFFSNTANSSLGLRNVLTHEHGHGLGLDHVCPFQQTKLMEPYVTYAFDGPQHDEILAVNRGYGDRLEDNDVVDHASDLGAPAFATDVFRDTLSIDGIDDADWYQVTVSDFSRLSVTVSPIGETYLSGPQNSDNTCSVGTSFNSLTQSNLAFKIIAPDQTTVLADANSLPAGMAEMIDELTLLDGAGTYYLQVSGDTDAAQLYDLTVRLSCDLPGDLDGDCDVDAGDVIAFNQLWLKDCQINDCGRANIVPDDIVDWQDYTALEQHWLMDLN